MSKLGLIWSKLGIKSKVIFDRIRLEFFNGEPEVIF